MTDRIEKTVDLKAPVSRLEGADRPQRVRHVVPRKLDAPLVPGRVPCGHKTSPGLRTPGNGRPWCNDRARTAVLLHLASSPPNPEPDYSEQTPRSGWSSPWRRSARHGACVVESGSTGCCRPAATPLSGATTTAGAARCRTSPAHVEQQGLVEESPMTDLHREDRVSLTAPVARVWKCAGPTTDEFGAWFHASSSTAPSRRARFDRPRHLSGLRASQVGGRRAEDRARALVLLHLAPSTPSSPAPTTARRRRRWSSSRWRRQRPARGCAWSNPASTSCRRTAAIPPSSATARAGRSRCRTSPSTSTHRCLDQRRRRRCARAPRSSPPWATRPRLGLLAKLTNGEPLSIARLTEGTRLDAPGRDQAPRASWRTWASSSR